MVKHAGEKVRRDFGLSVALVIIDTAGKAAGLQKTGDLNDDAVAKAIMRTLADAASQTGALFLGVAISAKTSGPEPKAPRGSKTTPTWYSVCSAKKESTASLPTQGSASASAAPDQTARSSASIAGSSTLAPTKLASRLPPS
jgi:hypothetical protein